MGLIEAFNFLLTNCNSSYQHFNSILSYFVETPKSYTHKSIGLSTDKIIYSSLSNLYSLFQSITGESTTLSQLSPLETMINIVNFSINQTSETISTLQKQLNSFQNSALLLNDQQNEMGIIDAFNFLLSNCSSSYKHFNNTLSYFIENPKYYTHFQLDLQPKNH
jgi:hypothetical protein